VPAPGRPAVVFAAAPLAPTARLQSRLAQLEQPFVVAADGGARTALAFGLPPDVVIGDLDSLDATLLRELGRASVAVETYPRDKDATDGQLAVERALAEHPSRLVLLGFLGGPRLDQLLANVLLLVRFQLPAVLLDERNETVLLQPGTQHLWRPEPDELISLIPIGGAARGVVTRGLRWALDGDRLVFGDTRGVSNEAVAEEASVAVDGGLLLLTRHFPA
jgi:thiamine pyrophosphokinase